MKHMQHMRKHWLRTIAAAAAIGATLAAPRAAAQLDARDFMLVPEYCRYSALGGAEELARDPARRDYWIGKLGREMFSHIHHYCMGLIQTNRSSDVTRPKNQRNAALANSIGEFDYVIRNARSDYVLMPEFLTKKGENLIRLGRAPQGINELNRAIEIKPDYWPPYAALSDYYKSAGEVGKAREILEKGLAADPDAKPLQRRAAELRGAKASGPTATSEAPGKKPAKAASAESKDAGESNARPEK